MPKVLIVDDSPVDSRTLAGLLTDRGYEVLQAHEAASDGLFRGIRHAGARDPHPEALSIPGRGAEGLGSGSGPPRKSSAS